MSNAEKVDAIFPAEKADWLNKIENNVYGHIDGKMLSNMLNIAFFLALKKGEVLNLKIGDVIDLNGQVKNEIQIGEDRIPLSKDDEQLIIDHLKHLRSDENYKDQSDAFLFQSKKGEQYGEAARQLRNTFNIDRPFQKLREASIKNKSLTSEKQRGKKVAKFARISPKQSQAIITGAKIPAGKTTDIKEKLQEIWEYTKKINRINEIYKDYLKDLKKQSKEIITSFNKSKKISDDLKGVFLKEVSEAFNKNKIVINAIDGSISLSSHKNISNSKMIKKVVPKDKKNETYEKLLWLIDHAVIFPTSDINEVDRYKDLFLNTLSTLSYHKDPQENKILKNSLMNSFADTFFERNVIFNNEIGSPYIWDKKKEDKDENIILTGLIQKSFKEEVSGKLDKSLLSILEDSKKEDLKQLVKYILKNRKDDSPSLEIPSYYFDDNLNDLKFIAKYIQKYQRDEKILGVKKLAPYKEVACSVADNLEVNYDQSQAIDVIEFKILEKILEYSWEDMDDKIKRDLLIGIFKKGIADIDLSSFPKEEIMSIIEQGGEEFYKISLIIANALSKSELNDRLIINRESSFVRRVQLFEDIIVKSFKKISIDSFNKGTDFFETLTYVIHIAMLRQLQKRRTILFRKFLYAAHFKTNTISQNYLR